MGIQWISCLRLKRSPCVWRYLPEYACLWSAVCYYISRGYCTCNCNYCPFPPGTFWCQREIWLRWQGLVAFMWLSLCLMAGIKWLPFGTAYLLSVRLLYHFRSNIDLKERLFLLRFHWDNAPIRIYTDRSFSLSILLLIPLVSCFSHKVKLRSPNKLEPRKLLIAGSRFSSQISKSFLIAPTVCFLIPRELPFPKANICSTLMSPSDIKC